MTWQLHTREIHRLVDKIKRGSAAVELLYAELLGYFFSECMFVLRIRPEIIRCAIRAGWMGI